MTQRRRPAGWKGFGAALAVVVYLSPAAAGEACPVPAVGAMLPVTSASTAHDLAAFALPFARLPRSVLSGAPPGFSRGVEWRPLLEARDPPAAAFALLSGFGAGIFLPCSGEGVVVVFDSTALRDPRDLVAGTLRQAFGGSAPLALRFLDAVAAAYPGRPILVVGHSSGGALASYAAGQRGLPSIVFNPSRTIAATTNPGTNQLVVIVEGDPIADPDFISLRIVRPPRQVPGITLRLHVEVARPFLDLHDIETVITGLEALL